MEITKFVKVLNIQIQVEVECTCPHCHQLLTVPERKWEAWNSTSDWNFGKIWTLEKPICWGIIVYLGQGIVFCLNKVIGQFSYVAFYLDNFSW